MHYGSVFTSRILQTDLQQSHCHCSIYEVFAQPNFFLAIILNHLRLPTLSIFCCKCQLRKLEPILIIVRVRVITL
jgi:hypothetical protein